MEWVETTARTVEEAQELALDQLGVVADEAEFEILTTPKPGLFGRLRGEARVRGQGAPDARPAAAGSAARTSRSRRQGRGPPSGLVRNRASTPDPSPSPQPARPGGATMTTTDAPAPSDDAPDVDAVRQAAVEFVSGLTTAFGFDTSVEATVEGTEIDVRVDGASLGLLIGPGGRTLLARARPHPSRCPAPPR